MSFKKVIEEHEQKREQEREARDRRIAELQEADAKLRADFDEAVAEVAKPIFERFVKEVQETGYTVSMSESVDGRGNPYLELRLLPEDIADPDPCDYAVFVLKGDTSGQKVEHNAYYDQRRGADGGTDKKAFGIGSIREETLERHLQVFLKQALESRDA